MEESFERVLLQKLYSLEKLSLRLSDKVQRSETENLKFLGKIHASINELERKAEEQCGKRRDKLQEKVSDLRELLFTSEGDASKTRESFSQGLGAKFKDVYEGLDKTNKIAGSF
jgi:DNA anti-recombination protein RmuC